MRSACTCVHNNKPKAQAIKIFFIQKDLGTKKAILREDCFGYKVFGMDDA